MLKIDVEKVIIERAKAKLSLSKLAKISNVGKATLSRIENKKVNPNAYTIGKIANALNIPIEELCFCENE